MITISVVSRDGVLAKVVERASLHVASPQGTIRLRIICARGIGDALASTKGTPTHLLLIDSAALPPRAFDSVGEREDPLRVFVETNPWVPIVIWAHASWLHPRRVLSLAQAGVREVILRGEEDQPKSMAALLYTLIVSRRSETLIRALPATVPHGLAYYLGNLIGPRMRTATPASMAAVIPCDRATLYRRLRAVGLPPPGILIGWIRIYLVACLIEEGLPAPRAANAAGLESFGNFVRMARHRTGMADTSSILQLGSRAVLRRIPGTVLAIEATETVSERQHRDASPAICDAGI